MSFTGNTSSLPKNEEAERSVLGAVLLDEQHLGSLMIDVQLRPEHFYVSAHGLIFQAILDLYESNSKIDHLTVGDRLKQKNELDKVGGQDAIEQLTGWVPTIGHAQEYGRIVREQSQMRGLIAAADEIRSDVLGRSATPRELLERAERSMLEVANDEERQRALRGVGQVLQDELENLEKRTKNKTALTGTPSGFKKLDELTGGFQPGNLIILAARPSMGKSALMANFAENAALAGKPVVLFSLEMGETELAQRFLASQARVKGDSLRFGKIEDREWPRIIDASARLAKSPLFIDDSSDLSILDMRAKSRRLHHQELERGGLGLIMVDYLQLMRSDVRIENRVEQVGQISRGLKALARELEVPVVALSQLSRNVEQRTGEGRKPVLSDLRESGQIEQDADLVMFIYREEYYTKDESERPGEADIIIAKHRNGSIGEVILTFQKDYPRFVNYVPPSFD
jgi:replicative DNA helicase